MNTKNRSSNPILITIAKVVIFALCICLAYLILRPLLGIILGISFWIIRVVVIVAVALLVLVLLLRLIFKIDILYRIFGIRWPK